MNPTVAMPEIKTKGSIGFDLQAQEDHRIPPKDSQLINTGVQVDICCLILVCIYIS